MSAVKGFFSRAWQKIRAIKDRLVAKFKGN